MSTRHPGEKNQTKAYICWRNIRTRCQNKKNEAYPNYGGRGIVLCKRWHSFANFLSDMGEPGIGMTIERINNEKGY